MTLARPQLRALTGWCLLAVAACFDSTLLISGRPLSKSQHAGSAMLPLSTGSFAQPSKSYQHAQAQSMRCANDARQAVPVHTSQLHRARRLLRPIGRLVVVGGLLAAVVPCSAVHATALSSSSSVLSVRKVSALVLACAAAGVWAEKHTSMGQVLSGAMVSFFLGLTLSSLGLLPTNHVVYDTIQTVLLPLAVCQLMLGLPKDRIAQTLRESSQMLIAFIVASVGTIVGALLAFKVVPLVQASNFAAVFTATYIGGTMNFVATADVLKFQDTQLLAAAFAADMVAMALYFAVLFYLGQRHRSTVLGAAGAAGNPALDAPRQAATTRGRELELEGLLSCLAVGSVLTWGGYLLAQQAGWAQGGVAGSCLLALLTSAALPRSLSSAWSNAPELVGGSLLQLFFVSIGAATNLSALLRSPALLQLLSFIAVILLTQAGFLWLIASRWLRVGLPDILLASNAAVGGSATAGGMAGALGWKGKVTPAVMCGTLGYERTLTAAFLPQIIGTVAGLAVSWMTQAMP